MNTHINTYIDIQNKVIASLNDCEKTDPAQIIKACFYTRALYISFIYAYSHYHNTALTVKELHSYICTNISRHCTLAKIISRVPANIGNVFDSTSIPQYTVNLGDLYQELLEHVAYDCTQLNNLHRKELGSYYTPRILAHSLTTECLNHYIEDNGLESLFSAKIADFSCGAGVFLTETLNYIDSIKEISNSDKIAFKIRIAKNLHGFDVDCIVLDIAILNIIEHCDNKCSYDELKPNFTHCNFLLQSDKETDANLSISANASGFVYHTNLAVDTKCLQNFDIILGNPPWEKIRFEEKKFHQIFENIQGSDAFKKYKIEYSNEIEKAKKQIKSSPFFEDGNYGELNTYALFTKAAQNLLSTQGVSGLIVKSSLVTSYVYSSFFNKLMKNIISIYDFTNKENIFNIDNRERFCLLIFNGHNSRGIKVAMNVSNIEEMFNNSFIIKHDDLSIINPITHTLPNIYTTQGFSDLLQLHRNNPCFYTVFPDIKFGRLVHFTSHKKDIIKESRSGYIPIYEGKFISNFDAMYSGFNNVPIQDRYKNKASSKRLNDADKAKGIIPESRYFIAEKKWLEISKNYNASYMLAWHSLTSATNNKTCVATILPFMPTSQSIQFLINTDESELLYLTGLFNSEIFDFVLKNKLNGIDLTRSVIEQTPIPSRERMQNTYINLGDSKFKAVELVIISVCNLLKKDTRLTSLTDKYLGKENLIDKFNHNELLTLIDIAIMKLYDMTDCQHLTKKLLSNDSESKNITQILRSNFDVALKNWTV